MTILRLICLLCVWLALSGCAGDTPANAAGADQPSTSIQNKGSDTMVNLALAWAERFQAQHAEFRISVTGGGSGTGISALVNGTVDVANASRSIKDEEVASAEARGFTPVEIIVARDAIAVIVNLANPVDRLTLQQVSDIYTGKIRNWKEVGGEDRPIVRLSRETNSGTHVYFLETVVRLGSKTDKSLFSPDTLLLPSSEGIIAEVRDNPNAIGYDGLGYVTSEVKTVAIARQAGEAHVAPSAGSVNDKTYPIARDLYMYTRGEPSGATKAYLDWILTPEAQAIVTELGFIPYRETP